MTFTRREFLQLLAIAASYGVSLGGRAFAAEKADDLYNLPKRTGNVTLLHFTDCHAQLLPIYFREPDVNPECEQYAEPGIEIVIGDQGDRAFLRSLSDHYPDVAILVDDGGHRMHQQIATLEELYPRLRSDGVYLCEDTHSSYMPVFGGGYGQPVTFIETVKRLVDQLNAFHTQDVSQLAPDEFTRSTDSMHFYDSVLVIERRPRMPPEQVTYGSIADFRYVAPSLSGR